MAGWGTTTAISSGKDIYIHYAAPEFAFALANDARSKAAVLYAEPGGHYELEADFNKPVVACVVGRWKARLTRAVGHAGAMAGGDDDAGAKEQWFMAKFGVDGIFTPENPVFSARGAVVTNIAHIPMALTAVMRENATRPDFPPEGSLALKPWFASTRGISLPAALDLPVVEAVAPYNEQIAYLNRQVGTVFPRQTLKDASGASQLDPKTQVASLHGVTMLDAAQNPLETNIALALVHEAGGENDRALVNVAVGSFLNLHGTPVLVAAQASREDGNAPNAVMAAAACLIGPRRVEPARRAVRFLVDAFAEAGLKNALDEEFDFAAVVPDDAMRGILVGRKKDAEAEALLSGLRARGVRSAFVRYLESLGGHPTADGVLAAISATLAWGPLMRKRISRLSVENLPWSLKLAGTLLGASVPAEPRPEDLFVFQTLIGLLLTNGPGAISIQGVKGAVSADGPETPERVQLNKALVGFLSHSGYAHGGNGYEGIAFLLDQFRDADLADPGDSGHGLDLTALAARYTEVYAQYKSNRKTAGSLDIQKIPGVNHPVFKDKPVNHDPREVFIWDLMRERGEYNVFHDYYRALVQALFDAGVSRTVYCVNIDAVIAALLLKMLWQPYRSGAFPAAALETAAFTLFLYARMIGSLAEADDHVNRGRNMDTRTPASQCKFVA
jgi:hypothetical protein